MHKRTMGRSLHMVCIALLLNIQTIKTLDSVELETHMGMCELPGEVQLIVNKKAP